MTSIHIKIELEKKDMATFFFNKRQTDWKDQYIRK